MVTSVIEDIRVVVSLCLSDASIPGPCGDEDPWDIALALSSAKPEDAWLFLSLATAQATTSRQFGRIVSGPLAYFWAEHDKSYRSRLGEASLKIPALVNLVLAEERRAARAADVMNLLYALTSPRPVDPPDPFVYMPSEQLAALATPGAHALTETLLVPNLHEFSMRSPSGDVPSEADVTEIIEGYVLAPDPPDNDDEDDWSWALDRLVADAPRAAWRAILRIIERESDGVDLGMLGAGALETLFSNYGESLSDEILQEIQRNRRFVRAFSHCYLFSLSEDLLMKLAEACRQMLSAA